jgi:hypothetical protein
MNDGGNLAVSPNDTNTVFCTGNYYNGSDWQIAVSHSSDGGSTWEHDTMTWGSNGLAVCFDPFDQNRVYVAGDSAYNYGCAQFLITTDLGASWTSSHTGLTGRVWTVAADPEDEGVLYAGTYQGVFKSTDGGATWDSTGFTRDTRALLFDPDDPEIVYAGTGGYGVSVSTDAGATWNPMNTGLTNLNVLSLGMRTGAENILFAGTSGGSVFRSDINTGVVGPGTPGSRAYGLAVTPNPCRELATISLSSSLVTPGSKLCLYDATGRLVRSLGAGASSVMLRTAGLQPGTYFVRLSDNSRTRTARLTIVE